ncbi:DUF1579 domain-containing protein [Massilia psychrophila]|uniref:DUF1579 domain-containing protein n=1 Tax=Massilia psychrophila TaxID=1603353 RepID=A0A2G8T2F3_9BURK|nr:DUF1579 domain-containing protein [Massilia psychrophila]PIL40240.1 DUF1579 domain-containing protein [Massilia psychrophila]GGE76154.1 hypothetical protein GCM10008020_21040 [Massilia psychrophila]
MALELMISAPTDFDFVIGDWFVTHRRLKERLASCNEWVEFDGKMSTKKILGGFGNIEDNLLQLPGEDVRAIALRSYDQNTRKWSIWWLDGRFPGQIDVPVIGSFVDGVGTFFANDRFQEIPITVRFVWRQIGEDLLHWDQAFSVDAGESWETNWTMAFRRQS